MSGGEQTNLLKPTSLKLRPLGVFLGAEVTGIDLSKPLNKKTLLAISRAHAEYGFLVFPNQPMSSKNLCIEFMIRMSTSGPVGPWN